MIQPGPWVACSTGCRWSGWSRTPETVIGTTRSGVRIANRRLKAEVPNYELVSTVAELRAPCAADDALDPSRRGRRANAKITAAIITVNCKLELDAMTANL